MVDLTSRERPYRPGRAAFDALRELGRKVTVKFLAPELSGLVDEVRFQYGPVELIAEALTKAMGLEGPAQFRRAEGTELQGFIDGQESDDAKRAAHQIVGHLAKPGVELARLEAQGHVFLIVHFPDGAVIGLRASK